jgi:hypothetical protein
MNEVWEEESKYFIRRDLNERLFRFAVNVINGLRDIPKSP